MNKWILICCLGALVSACGSGEQTASDTKTESAPTQAPPSSQVYPSLPVQRLEELWQVCDYIDFVFYNTNFSMNQSEQASIQKTLRHVAAEVPDIKPECKAVGHLFYQSKGRILLEADLYFSPGCAYFVFMENGKPAYANEMTPDGVEFYNKIFSTYNK